MVTIDSDPRGKESSGKLTPKALRKALFLVESNRFVGNIHVSRADEEKRAANPLWASCSSGTES